jgi:hypothetical protein
MPPKVTMNPPQATAPAATAPVAEPVEDRDTRHVVDGRGRKLTVTRPDLLAEFRFVEAAGPEAAANTIWMGMVMPLIYLRELDGELIIPPISKRQIDALISRVGREGYVALATAIQSIIEADAERERQSVKNS